MRRTGIDLSSIRCNVVDAESSGRRRRGAAGIAFACTTSPRSRTSTTRRRLTAELKALSRAVLAPRVGELVGRAQQPSVPVAAVGAGRRARVARAPPRRLGARHERSRRDGRDVDRRNARRAWTSSEARSLVLRRRIGRHSRAASANRRRRVHCRRSHDSVRRVMVAGAVAAALAARRGARACRARRVAVGARNFRRRRACCMREIWIGATRRRRWERPWRTTASVLADRLSTELRRSFLYLKQYWEQDVSQVLLCGDMPEIRSLTAPLIDRLNIEVETLDTLDGIDTATLPEGFADRAPTLRLRVVDCSRAASGESAAGRSDGDPHEQDRAAHRGSGHCSGGCDRRVSLWAGERDADRRRAAARRRAPRHVVAAGCRSRLRRPQALAARVNGRSAALEALDAQGPAMARVLEALATPRREV